MSARYLWLLVGTLALGSCGKGAGTALELREARAKSGRGPLEAFDADHQTTFVRRVDGNVKAIYRQNATEAADQWVVLTGRGSGTDQGSVLVFAQDGRLMARHRVGGDSPWGHRLSCPNASRLAVHTHHGRRFLAFTTAPIETPYSLEIVEARDAKTLVPRLRLWNRGAIDPGFEVAGGLLAFRAVNNSFRKRGADRQGYPVVVGIVDLATAAATQDVIEAIAPYRIEGEEHAGSGYRWYFLLPQLSGPSHGDTGPISFDGKIAGIATDRGLTYKLNVETGQASVEASDTYATWHESQRTGDASLPPLPEHLDKRAAGVRVFRVHD